MTRRPALRWAVLLVAALLLVAAPRTSAEKPAAAEPSVVLNDFEDGLPEGWAARGAEAQAAAPGGVRPGKALRLTGLADAGAAVSLPLTAGQAGDLSEAHSLRFASRAEAAERGAAAVDLRWLALDESGRPLFQKRFKVEGGGDWRDVELPLHEWRWGNESVGAWSDVRRLVLKIESPAREIWLDDLALPPAGDEAAPAAASDWFRNVAFGGADARFAEGDGGVLVGTDAVDALDKDDLARIAGRMAKARAMVNRLFGDAVRPVDDRTPPALLIFRGDAGQRAFWKRLGEAWGAQIAPPSGGGYTVTDISTSTFDPARGADRPVYLHESVHAVVAHDLRLLTGSEHHAWLHEGLANYVQLCVYPESLDRETYPRNFARENPTDGRGLFRPLRELLSRRADPRTYAQLASVVAYLVERRPETLPKIARALADGKSGPEAFKAAGTSVEEVEKGWLEWGRKRFPAGGEAPEHFFDRPAEWAEGDRRGGTVKR